MKGPQRQLVTIESHSQSLPVDEKSAEEKLLSADEITGMPTEKIVAGRRGTFVSSSDAAGLAFRERGNLFVVTAKGANAAQLLTEAVSTLQLQN